MTDIETLEHNSKIVSKLGCSFKVATKRLKVLAQILDEVDRKSGYPMRKLAKYYSWPLPVRVAWLIKNFGLRLNIDREMIISKINL